MPEITRVRTRSFEPDPDVAAMIDMARKDGITLTFIINSGARAWLIKKGYARKKSRVANPA